MVLATTLTVEVDSILSAADSAQQHDLQTALSNLHSLQSLEVTTQLLSETQVGKKIRKLTKHTDAGIAEASKIVLAKWKECVRQEQEGPSKRPSDSLDREDSKSSGSNKRAKLEPTQPVKAEKLDANHPSLEELKASLPRLDDPVRHKTAQLMLDGLYKAVQEGAEGDAVAVAASIEHAVFLQNGGVTAAYKTKVRSLAFNMRDARNPDLRARVLEGKISGHVLVDLSSDELASDERRKENKEIKEYKLKEANPAGMKKATTDAFQCGKCKQKKCVYYQMQTRSADELSDQAELPTIPPDLWLLVDSVDDLLVLIWEDMTACSHSNTCCTTGSLLDQAHQKAISS